jgi:CheY-like chemotaxis protein
MEAVGQLAGGIAHDFNNLLTAIIGNAEFLRDDLPVGDPRQADLQEILDASSGAAGLTRQLLAFSRKQVLEPRVIAVAELVTGIERMLRRLLGEHIDLVKRLDHDTGNVRADPGQIEQVLVNLAVNAADAMPDGGTLILETENVELDGDYTAQHAGVEPGPHVLLAVSDSGVGMSDEVKERLFEPFFTTKEPGRGTGLGLATVYGIVKQSGGSIWVYSEPGEGSTFKIYLPRVLDREAEPPAPKIPVGARGTETVLLVEDDRLVRRLSRRALESRGYTVLEADGPSAALALASEHSGTIAALVTDVVMPGMSGRALAERMAEIRPKIKVLYTSGYTADAIARHGVLEPGVWFLQKPYSREALGAKLREVLDS